MYLKEAKHTKFQAMKKRRLPQVSSLLIHWLGGYNAISLASRGPEIPQNNLRGVLSKPSKQVIYRYLLTRKVVGCFNSRHDLLSF